MREDSSKVKSLLVAGIAVLAVVTLTMALRGSAAMWLTFAGLVISLGLAWARSHSDRGG